MTGHALQVIAVVRRVTPQIRAPIIMFTYYNPIMRRGLDTFCAQIKDAGAAGSSLKHLPPTCTRPPAMQSSHRCPVEACGVSATSTRANKKWPLLQGMQQQHPSLAIPCCTALLVPDIPLEETGPVRDVAGAHGLELVLLTTPTTPMERMEAIARKSQGFVYLVSVTGGPAESRMHPPMHSWRGAVPPAGSELWVESAACCLPPLQPMSVPERTAVAQCRGHRAADGHGGQGGGPYTAATQHHRQVGGCRVWRVRP